MPGCGRFNEVFVLWRLRGCKVTKVLEYVCGHLELMVISSGVCWLVVIAYLLCNGVGC